MGEVETKVPEAPEKRKKRLPLWLALGAVAVAAVAAVIVLLSGGKSSSDDWLRKALAEDSTRTIELNEDIKATKGYEVNGNKTIVGTGKISMNEASNYVFSVNDGASLTVDGITVNVMNIGNHGVVVRSGGKLEWKSGTISYPKEYAIISYGETAISGGTFEFAGSNWLYVKSGTKAEVTGGYFVKSGAVGFEVEKGAQLTISGKDTLIERAGTNTINNLGTVSLSECTISQSEVWTITNHGALTMDGVTVKDCSLKGVLYNYADAVSADISNCTFTNNKTYHIYNKSVVTVKDTAMSLSGASSLNNQPGATMTIENVSLTDCGYHAIYNDRGTINIINCSVDTTVYKGVQNKTGYVTIDGLTLDNVGGAGLGNVAYVEGGGYGYIHANNVTATNTVDYNVVSYGGEVKLSNSVFNETPGTNVYLRNGTFELDSVKILGTTTAGKVTLVLGSDAYRTVEGSIKGDTLITGSASRGVTNYGTLYIYGGTITGNKPSATSKAGGGIYTLGDVYMYGGSITGNTAITYGGGIRVDADDKSVANLYMYGGSIANNYAGSNGGGISIADPECGLYMYGGTVSGNSCGNKGDGILVNGTFQLYDGAVIKNNDVYLWNEERVIDVKSSSLSGSPLVIRHGGLSENVVIAKFPSESAAASLADHFTSANNQFAFVTEGKKLVAKITENDLVSPVDFDGAQQVTVSTFAQLKSAVENTSGKKIIKIAADIPMTGIITVPASASVKLIDDGTARTLTRSGYKGELFRLNREANLYVAGNAGLTLDGNSLSGATAEMPLIFSTVESYVVLESGAVLQNNTNTSYATSACAGAVNLYGGRMIVDGGVIRNCNGPSYETAGSEMTNRPAVYVSTTGVLSVKSGEIFGNLNGAIRSYGRVYISGGEIKDNVRNGDGGAAIRAPWIYMTGGTISGNKSTNGGGAVYLTPSDSYPEGYFYMNGGTITGNFSGVNDADPSYDYDTVGGAVYVDQNCVFDCVAGTISNNQAIGDKTGSNIGQNGGGIVNDGTVYLRSGAVVSGNYAARNGGGIFCRNKAATLIIEGATISDNYTSGRGGAIFTEGANNTVTITGATIENNKAMGAGAILFGGGTGSVSDTVFRGNVAERIDSSYGNAGAIMNQSSTTLTLTNVTFEGNKAIAKDGGGGCGGAVYNSKAVLILNGVVSKDNEARVADDIFFSADTMDNTVNGAFDVTEIYLEGDQLLHVGENFTGRADSGLILVDLPNGSTTNRYLAGEQLLTGSVNETVSALFTLGEGYPSMSIGADGCIAVQGQEPGTEPDDPQLPIGPVAKIGDVEYDSLAEAVAAANEGDTIVVVANVVLSETLSIEKAITITTDGVADRTISGGAAPNLIHITAGGVKLIGTADSRLVIDGGSIARESLIRVECADAADLLTMEYVTVQKALSSINGGAISLLQGKLVANECIFDSNEVNAASTKSGSGGALYMEATVSSAEITNSKFTNNKVNYRGGAIYGSKEASLTLTNCLFEGNKADNAGGAILSGRADGQLLTNCTFTDNTSGAFGGAIAFSSGTSSVTLDSCTFTGNTANGTQAYAGGAISVGTAVTVTGGETTIVDNAAPNGFGGGIGTQKAAGTASVTVEEGATLNIYNNTQSSGGEVSFKGADGTITNHGTLNTEAPEDPYAAMIGTTGYITLAEAVAAANEGDTIVIVADVVLSETLTIEKAITITTDGVADRTITGTPSANNYYINIKAEAAVTLKGTGEDSRLIIDGENQTHDRALVAVQTADSVLEYVVLQNNVNGNAEKMGGALYVNKTGVVLNHCVLQGNKSGGGGAMYATGEANVTLNTCQILGNTSTKYGGAFQGASGSVTTLNNCQVEGNTASNVGGVAYMAQSGGTNPATLVAENTVFKDNSTSKTGGVLRATGAFALTGCTFTGNSGSDGDISEGNATAYTRTITNCTFDKTEAAAIAKNASTQVVVTGCTFAEG